MKVENCVALSSTGVVIKFPTDNLEGMARIWFHLDLLIPTNHHSRDPLSHKHPTEIILRRTIESYKQQPVVRLKKGQNMPPPADTKIGSVAVINCESYLVVQSHVTRTHRGRVSGDFHTSKLCWHKRFQEESSGVTGMLTTRSIVVSAISSFPVSRSGKNRVMGES